MDPELLGRILDQHQAALVLFARQWCGTPEDVVQEAFLKLAGQRPTPSNPVAWLFRVVRNGAMDAGQSARRRRRHEQGAAADASRWFEMHPARTPGDLDPQDAARELERLPIEEREIIVAHLWGGLTFEQIAEATGSSSSTTHRLYLRGIACLRDRLGVPCPRSPSDSERDPIESALARLRPAHRPIDRDRLMFQAGVAAARAETRGRWIWPSIAATLALVSLSESIALATRPTRVVTMQEPVAVEQEGPANPTVEILVQRPSTSSLEDDRPWADGEALGLRRQVLRLGPEGLPELPPLLSLSDGPEPEPTGKPGSPDELRRLEIEKLLNPGGPS